MSEFYDNFRDSRMVKYRVDGNLRIDRAIARVSSYLEPQSRVLEIGCGIGIVTEELAARVPRGHVWGCDISPRNVDFARRTVRAQNTTFLVGDVLKDLEGIQRVVGGPVDVVALIDVIEHLPLERHASLFASLKPMLGRQSRVVLTYPSPQYQNYLMEHEPEELQIIDEVVELPGLILNAATAALVLCHYSLEDVWRHNQYAHAVFQVDRSVDRLAPVKVWGPQRLLRRAVRFVRRRRVARTLRRLATADTAGQPPDLRKSDHA